MSSAGIAKWDLAGPRGQRTVWEVADPYIWALEVGITNFISKVSNWAGR